MLVTAQVRRESLAPFADGRVAAVLQPRRRIVVGDRMIARDIEARLRDELIGIVCVVKDAGRLRMQAAKGRLADGAAALLGSPGLEEVELALAKQLGIGHVDLCRRVPGGVVREAVLYVCTRKPLVRRGLPFAVFEDGEAYAAPLQMGE
jgi:hypothetical protein